MPKNHDVALIVGQCLERLLESPTPLRRGFVRWL